MGPFVTPPGEEPRLAGAGAACPAEPGGGSRYPVIGLGWGGSVNVEYGLAADAAVQQGVDRGPGLAP